MTGFGSSQVKNSHLGIDVNIRAINGRFFEPKFHLPREYFMFESEVRTTLAKYFQRGTIDIYISRKLTDSLIENLDENLVKEFHQLGKKLAKIIGTDFKPSVELFLKNHDSLKKKDISVKTSLEKKLLLEAVEQACQNCLKEREREGSALEKNLLQILKELNKKVKIIEGHQPEIRQELHKKMTARLDTRMKEWKSDIQLDPDKLYQEVLFVLDRMDIDEEITRLCEHLKQFEALLKSDGSVGKKLDFYTQELLRETNTIGSKQNVQESTKTVVEMKTWIERLKEQVQNIE